MKTILCSMLVLAASFQQAPKDKKAASESKKEAVAMEAKDPVCKMHAEKDTKFTSTYKGKQYGFCSVVCKEMFDKKPENFVKK